MGRGALAALCGAVVSVVVVVTAAAIVFAVTGIEQPYGAGVVYGWEAAQLGAVVAVLAAVVKVWPLLAVLLVGAAIGLAVRAARRGHGTGKAVTA
jgi:hypothetical protein